MAWKFIKLDKVVSQKECNNFLEKEENKKLLKLLRIQKTCADGAITLKLGRVKLEVRHKPPN
ncbi:hypothetical protein C5U09_15090 [Acinetobacter baumannii]|uniref:hypothetical protein n=1 Tax=Acinetobacter baumannii TaxID=470 RepID=UPI000CF32E12|nr:hypothetical protein [Acinetobacter baumannii]PQI49724.1 hypothetical protein C5U09_15090 [Acinetobacter baumannii]